MASGERILIKYTLLMTANKLEIVLYRAPTFSLLLVSHGGLVHVCYFIAVSKGDMGVASGCGYQEVGVASGSGWNLWVWLVGGMYGCDYQEVGVVGRRRVWLAGGMYGCGYQEVGVVSRRQVWLVGGMYGCGYQVGVVGNYWCG